MVRKYSFGKPFFTGAATRDVPAETGAVPFFEVKKEEGNFIFRLDLLSSDAVYGLGEQVRGINKRGWIYVSDNFDDPAITEDRTGLYATHNFMVIAGEERTFGVFFDCAEKAVFDIGYTDIDVLTVSFSGGADVYFMDGTDILGTVREFRNLAGQSYIPPKWAFGFGQSRWGYGSEEDIKEVAEEYYRHDFPLDAVYLDIDYMDNYKCFTVNGETFPHFKDFVLSMRERGIHLVPIIDAAVKAEEGYSVYDEGIKKGYFCKDKDGKPYIVGVWPGDSVLPDVLNEDAAAWFGSQYKALLDAGIEGFWNDMNEPSLFYSRKRLEKVIEKISDMGGRNLSLSEFWGITGGISSLANNHEDYKEFYHETKQGRISHEKVHNLYGYYMTRAAAEYFEKYNKDRRYLLFSRSSAIGMHRYGGIWTGDNASRWSHLLLNLKMLPSLNMCGFLYVGADIGGFGGNTTEDLLLRWMALGVFTPLMRNHSSLGSRRQECYVFKNENAFRNILNLRYRLIPYLYSEFVRCSLRGDMFFKPLAFVYTDDGRAKTVEDELLVGDSLMIAPVYEQNADGRYVYLPERMKLIRMCPDGSLVEKITEKGSHYIKVALNEVVFFLREGHVLPLARPAKNVGTLDEEHLDWIKFTEKPVVYELCRDNGETKSGLEKKIEKITVYPD